MIKINSVACIGCGMCESSVSEVFKVGEEGFAEVINNNYEPDLHERVLEMIDMCPTGAISEEKNDN